jgi:hypothetical protein
LDNDYYGCPNCNGEGTLDETTYCTCELGQDMEHQHRKEPTMKIIRQYLNPKTRRFIQLRPSVNGLVDVCDHAGWTGATQTFEDAERDLIQTGFVFDRTFDVEDK